MTKVLILAGAIFAIVSGACALFTLAAHARVLRRAPKWEVCALIVLVLLGVVAGVVLVRLL